MKWISVELCKWISNDVIIVYTSCVRQYAGHSTNLRHTIHCTHCCQVILPCLGLLTKLRSYNKIHFHSVTLTFNGNLRPIFKRCNRSKLRWGRKQKEKDDWRKWFGRNRKKKKMKRKKTTSFAVTTFFH